MLAVIERLTDMPQGTIGFRAGALWADTRLGFDLGVRHHRVDSLGHRHRHPLDGARDDAWTIPGEARVFPRDELEQAKAWVALDS